MYNEISSQRYFKVYYKMDALLIWSTRMYIFKKYVAYFLLLYRYIYIYLYNNKKI